MPITVLVVDDNHGLRRALIELLSDFDDLRVLAEASDAAEGIRAAAHHQPDVIILDQHMPGQSGAEALAEIHAAAPLAHVMIWTAHPTPWLSRRLRVVPRGSIIAKGAGPAVLLAAIRQTATPRKPAQSPDE